MWKWIECRLYFCNFVLSKEFACGSGLNVDFNFVISCYYLKNMHVEVDC